MSLQITMEVLPQHSQINNTVECQLLIAALQPPYLQLQLILQVEQQSQINKLLKILRSTDFLAFSKQAQTLTNSSYLFGIIHGSYLFSITLDFGDFYFYSI
jgi:hypothetical protein